MQARGRGPRPAGARRRAGPSLPPLPPSPVIWKCRKWDYPGTDVHKRGEMESVTAGQPLITSDCHAVRGPVGTQPPARALPRRLIEIELILREFHL